MRKKIFAVALAATMALTSAITAFGAVPTPLYFNDFEEGLGTELTQVGSGEFVTDADANFGQVYHNNPALNTSPRTNYLLLPSDTLAGIEGKTGATISFWVNLGTHDATFPYSIMFGAYGSAPTTENTWPCLTLQSRLLTQINLAGYCDFGNALNDEGTNVETIGWVTDGDWHLYTVTYTSTSATIYVDGVVRNSWTVDGTSAGQVIGGLFTNASELDYVALGGNQAFNWGDKDSSFMFDDFAVYGSALTQSQIAEIIAAKNETTEETTEETTTEEATTVDEEATTVDEETTTTVDEETTTTEDSTLDAEDDSNLSDGSDSDVDEDSANATTVASVDTGDVATTSMIILALVAAGMVVVLKRKKVTE